VGTLTLTASSTYTGNTAVNAGALALTGTGSINNSAVIVVAAGATLDASGRSDGALTLASNAMLKGNGTVKGNVIIGNGAMLAPGGSLGTLRFNNNLTLDGGSTTVMEVSKSPLTTNDAAQISGSLLYGGTLLITNVSLGSFSAGDSFKLFNAASYAGVFTNIVPAIPAANLAWNTNGLDNGILSIMSSPMPRPQIGVISFTGNEFAFSGTGGAQWWSCHVLASSNLALPLSNWTVLASNRFDAAGNVLFQITPTKAPQQFYLLRSP
jgi:autotransporter-associated beta strand protein